MMSSFIFYSFFQRLSKKFVFLFTFSSLISWTQCGYNNPDPLDPKTSKLHLTFKPTDSSLQALKLSQVRAENYSFLIASDIRTLEVFSLSCEWLNLPPFASGPPCYLYENSVSFQENQSISINLHMEPAKSLPLDLYKIRITAKGLFHSQTFDFSVQIGAFFLDDYDIMALWGRELATSDSGTDEVKALVTDSQGNIYVAFNSTGSLEGHPNRGDFDAFLIKYTPQGAVSFISQLGTSKTDQILALTLDQVGRLSVVGRTYGTFPAQTSMGGSDVFVAQISDQGQLLWLQQFGTNSLDQGNAITVTNQGHLYIAGSTEGSFPGTTSFGLKDAWVALFDAAGNQKWIKNIGTDFDDDGTSITTDLEENFYLAGNTLGMFPGATPNNQTDWFLAQGTNDGSISFIKQLGSIGNDNFASLLFYKDELYGVGSVRGSLAAGTDQTTVPKYHGVGDAVLLKWKKDGTLLWVQQVGSEYTDEFTSFGFGSDALYGDTIWAIGNTKGFFPGSYQIGLQDVMLVTFQTGGQLLHLSQFGTEQVDMGTALSVFGDSIYVAGTSFGFWPNLAPSYASQNPSKSKGFLFKIMNTF